VAASDNHHIIIWLAVMAVSILGCHR
jgi:hypothetical protein